MVGTVLPELLVIPTRVAARCPRTHGADGPLRGGAIPPVLRLPVVAGPCADGWLVAPFSPNLRPRVAPTRPFGALRGGVGQVAWRGAATVRNSRSRQGSSAVIVVGPPAG